MKEKIEAAQFWVRTAPLFFFFFFFVFFCVINRDFSNSGLGFMDVESTSRTFFLKKKVKKYVTKNEKKKYFFLFFFRNHVNHVKFFFKKRHVREVSRNPIFGKKVLFFRHVLSTSMGIGISEK